MEQEGGAELGASGGRLEVEEEEVEAATPPGCCGDADDVVEVDASVVLSIPPLLAPRRCVAVVAVPIRQDADPPSGGRGKNEGGKKVRGGDERGGGEKNRRKKKAALACFLSPRPLKSHPSEEGARSTVSTCSETLRSTAGSLPDSTPTVPCVGRDTRKPPLPPAVPLSPRCSSSSCAVVEAEDASTTTLPSSPLGTGTGGGEEGRADLAGAPGAERPRYDHMAGRESCAKESV